MAHPTDRESGPSHSPVPASSGEGSARTEPFPLRIGIGFFLAAFLVRIVPAATVFWTDEVMLRDADATYHLRRVLYFLENFPSTLEIDPYVQFPHGSKIIWPAFLDVCFGLVLWPVRAVAELLGADWMHAVSVGAAWLPPLIGAVTVVAAFALARRHFGLQAALICASLLSVLGGHYVYSQLGGLDHHVVVSLVSVLLLGAMFDLLSGSVSARKATTQHGLILGAWSGLGLLVWPGNLLYVGIALLGLALAGLLAPESTSARSRFRALAIAGSVAALLIAPFSLGAQWPQWNAFSPVVLTNFQPWILSCAALVGLVGMAGIGGFGGMRTSQQSRFESVPLLRAFTLLSFSFLLLSASFLFLDGLSDGLTDAWRWLGKGEEFQASVIESQGLFVVAGQYSTFMATLQLSPILYVFPFIWLYGAYVARDAENKEVRVFLLVWSLVLFAITLLQKRFVDTFSIALALQTGLGASDLIRLTERPAHKKRIQLAFAALALYILYALHPNYTPHLQNLWSAANDAPPALNRFQRADFIMSGVSRWLREFTPPTSGWLDQNEKPEYGIMASWGHGHMLQHVARRPTVTDNFGDDAGPENFELEKQFWASPNRTADAILERLGVRYVVVTGGNALLPKYAADATYRSLYLYDGSLFREGKQSTPASSRYRLVMESQKLQSNLRYAFAKVFEFVPGARLQGRTIPGREIKAKLQIRTTRGRDIFYSDEQIADANGEFEFIVSYPNSGGPTGLVVASGYRVLCGESGIIVEVTEAEIQAGKRIAVGDPCGQPTP